MFFLTLCLIGFAAAAPAIPDAPILPAESHVLVAPYIAYPALAPLKTLEIMIEPEPKEEDAELPEPKEELLETEEPEELKLEEPRPEEPRPEDLNPEEPKPTVVKLDVPKPPQFITDFFANLPFTFPHIPYISDWLSSNKPIPPKIMYPAFYPGYAGAVIVEAAKP